MAIADWSATTVKRVWLWGGLAEAALILSSVMVAVLSPDPPAVDPIFPESAFQGPATRLSASDRRDVVERVRPMVDSLGWRIESTGDSTIRLSANDSAAISVYWKDDTIHRVSLSPATKRALDTAVASFGDAFARGMWLLMGVVALYLAIPVSLVIVTAYWMMMTRRRIQAAA